MAEKQDQNQLEIRKTEIMHEKMEAWSPTIIKFISLKNNLNARKNIIKKQCL